MIKSYIRLIYIFIFCIISSVAHANAVVVKNIIVEGNERLVDSTVASYTNIQLGDKVSKYRLKKVIRDLYKTNYFSRVSAYTKGSALIINVKERPVIKSIELKNNSVIPDSAVKDILKKEGLEKGRFFDPAPLKELLYAIKKQYELQGFKDVTFIENVKFVEGNRVEIKIKVIRNKRQRIRGVSIYGNSAFSKHVLMKKMSLSKLSLYSWIFGGNYYSEEAVKKNIDDLKLWYDSNGYLSFRVEDYSVKKIKDSNLVDLTIYLKEGPLFTLKDLSVEGDDIVKNTKFKEVMDLKKKISGNKKVPFSREVLRDIKVDIRNTLEKKSYPLLEVESKFDVDEKNHSLKVVFKIRKGEPKTIRYIEFRGNTYTLDKVLRREMAAVEGQAYAESLLVESQRRISNLPYLKNVTYKLEPVADRPMMVDVIFDVEEVPSATLNADLGYNKNDGIVASTGLTHPNFMGTGNDINLKLETAVGRRTVMVKGYTPFVFNNGLGVGYNLQYDMQKARTGGTGTTNDHTEKLSYSYNKLAAGLSFKAPLTLYQNISLGTNISSQNYYDWDNSRTPSDVRSYLKEYGDTLFTHKFHFLWSYNSLNQSLLPTKGSFYTAGLDIGVPWGDKFMGYYTLKTKYAWFLKLTNNGFTLNPSAAISIGGGFKSFKDLACIVNGGTDSECEKVDLPFSQKFYGGGIDPVRGVVNLGDKFMDKSLGGDLLTTVSLNLNLPTFISDSVHTSLFADGGYVYNQHAFSLDKWVYSAGVQARIMTPMAPVVLIYSVPLKIHDTGYNKDIFKSFQFSFKTDLF